MSRAILGRMDFRRPGGGWSWPPGGDGSAEITPAGCLADAPGGRRVRIDAPGVHTRSGDSIELHFELPRPARGRVTLAFAGGMERLAAELDLRRRRVVLRTSEWDRRQPVASGPVRLKRRRTHVLRIDKTEGAGGRVKLADARVGLDGQTVLTARGLNVLPEMGAAVGVSGGRVLLRRFVHRGEPSGVPERLRVAGWQMPNRPDIDANLESIRRGLRAAAERGARLLVTPETSLTGLFPRAAVTRRPGPIAAAERKLRRFLRGLKDAPYLVAGLPVWQGGAGGRTVRYNASRVYDPDGQVVLTGAKVHSCEADFWHGYRLCEFEIDGVACCMHVCHDGRYPEVWTLPIMFGARLVVHPCNSGPVGGSVDGFEARSKAATATMHAFYVRVNGGGGSAIVGPAKHDNLLVVSDECRRDSPAFPAVGPVTECLLTADVRIHDAFGYWPVRSFRASEPAAAAYAALYRTLGGRSSPLA